MTKSPYFFLFDYDGVLIYKINFGRYAAVNHGINQAALGRFFKQYLQPCLRGEKDMLTLLEAHREEIGWEGSARELFAAIYVHERLFQPDLMRYIERKIYPNYPCYVATNQDQHRFELIKQEKEIQALFKEVFCSCDFGVAKPNVEYFHRLFERLQKTHPSLRTDQLIFTDDIPENVESAESIGIHAHLFQETPTFTHFVERVLNGRRFPIIQTSRLSLEKMKFSQAGSYADILSDPETYHFLTGPKPQNKEKALEKIIRNRYGFDSGKSIYWSINNKANEFLGYIAIHNLNTPRVAMSYGIHPQFRRKGIASEAIKAVISNPLLKGKTIEIATHLDNDASFKLLMKLGIPYQGVKTTQFGERNVFEWKGNV